MKRLILILFLSVVSLGAAQDSSKVIEHRRETNPVKIVASLALRFYRNFITTQDNQECQFNPSCSKYAVLVYRRDNPLKATLETGDRLLRCNPFAYKYYPADSTGHLVNPPREKRSRNQKAGKNKKGTRR